MTPESLSHEDPRERCEKIGSLYATSAAYCVSHHFANCPMWESSRKGPNVSAHVLQQSGAPSAWHLSVPEYLSLYIISCNSRKLSHMSEGGISNVFPLKSCWITCYTIPTILLFGSL